MAELVISIGVLILMMALAGQVFTITIKSTGQATGLTEVTQQLRVLEETLREDLRNVHPGQSVMVIQGNPVNAFWTQLGKDAAFDQADPSKGYGHARDLEREKLDANGAPVVQNGYEIMQEPRADILMFFTARKATSTVDPRVSSRVQQVTYGHAEMGEYQPAATPSTYDMTTTAFPAVDSAFAIPAQQWHLARRGVLIVPTDAPAALSWPDIIAGNPDVLGLGHKELLHGQTDILSNFRFDDLVLKPFDDKVGWDSEPPWYLPPVFGETLGVAKNQWHQPYARCKLDSTPPMMMANRMGAYFAPNCASFKVEWSLDPRSPFVAGRLDGMAEVIWIDHGASDPLISFQRRIEVLKTKPDAVSLDLKAKLESLMCDQTKHADGSFYSLADRFGGTSCPNSYPSEPWDQLSADNRPNTAAFTATRPNIDPLVSEMAPDDIWPGALRITVDLYDRELRLDRPIRHVMVIPIGG